MGKIIGETVEEYLSIKSELQSKTGCIEWTGYIGRLGYGEEPRNYWFKKFRVTKAHQLSYVSKKGEYRGKGLELSHLCHNKKCIKIEHLKLETRRENIERNISNRRDKKMFLNINFKDLINYYKREGFNKTAGKFNISKHKLRRILKGDLHQSLTGITTSIYDYCKIRNEHFIEIKQLRDLGFTHRQIANKMKCSASMVCLLLNGQRRRRFDK